MSGTKRFVEQRILNARKAEAKDAGLRRKVVENNIYAGYAKSAVRVEEMRRSRSEAAVRRDLFMDYTYVQAEQEKERRSRISHFEENLADELARRKAEALRDEMDKRRICDGSEELRALKERLHAAKVNKERAQQLHEGEIRKERGRVQEHMIAEHMENERVEHVELELKLTLEKGKQRERVKFINQQQITTKEAQRCEAMQEYLKEKDQVNDLVVKIEMEDAEEAGARALKQEESKASLKQFMVDQQQKQREIEQAERDENDRIEQYARDKRAREERLAAEKEEAEKQKGVILKKMLGQAEAANREKEELERLRNDLYLEQHELDARRREELTCRKRLEDREEMKNAYVFQMQMKEEKANGAREEEERIRSALLLKFAEDDRIEQMSEQKRRMKVEQHKREAERLTQLRREMFDQARDAERNHEGALREEEMSRQIIIESERKRLLKEHAAGLKDFLPKATFETREDYELVFGKTGDWPA